MAHISRKELKKDEFRETLAHGAEAVVSHWDWLWKIGVPVLVVALGVFGWRWYSDWQTTKASAALAQAMEVYDAPIRAPGEAAPPGQLSYIQEKNKYEDALKKLTAVAQSYSHTSPGRIARYYAALSLEHLGRSAEAQKQLEELAQSGNRELASLARFELAKLYDQTGKGEQAVPLYQELIKKPTTLVPKPVALLALADHYVKSNPAEATRLYNQLKTEFPNTALADEADKRLELLPGKS